MHDVDAALTLEVGSLQGHKSSRTRHTEGNVSLTHNYVRVRHLPSPGAARTGVGHAETMLLHGGRHRLGAAQLAPR